MSRAKADVKAPSKSLSQRQNGWGGTRTPLENTGKTGVSDQSGAKSGAVGAQTADFGDSATDPMDPELAAVVDAWPALPAAIKAGILAMVRAAK